MALSNEQQYQKMYDIASGNYNKYVDLVNQNGTTGNTAMDNAVLNKINIDKGLQGGIQNINNKTSVANQTADILNQKMMKYINMSARVGGTGGQTGLTASNMIEAQNNTNNTMSQNILAGEEQKNNLYGAYVDKINQSNNDIGLVEQELRNENLDEYDNFVKNNPSATNKQKLEKLEEINNRLGNLDKQKYDLLKAELEKNTGLDNNVESGVAMVNNKEMDMHFTKKNVGGNDKGRIWFTPNNIKPKNGWADSFSFNVYAYVEKDDEVIKQLQSSGEQGNGRLKKYNGKYYIKAEEGKWFRIADNDTKYVEGKIQHIQKYAAS